MKLITLATPAIIAGVVRYPIEGSFIVTNDEAARQKAAGTLDIDPEEVPEGVEEAPAEPVEPATPPAEPAEGQQEPPAPAAAAEPDEEPAEGEPSADLLESLTAAQLNEVIAAEGVSISASAPKFAKVVAIRTHRAEAQ